MASFTVDLGSAGTLVRLFSYPNRPGSTESLAETIRHWVNQMLARDGFAMEGGSASVRVDGAKFLLDLNGPDEMKSYVDHLPRLLKCGEDALDVIEKKIMKGKPKSPWPDWVNPKLQNRLWDPWNRGTWRFFLPIGMALVRQKSVNYFHYPPMRLLEQRDYLADPVPVRLIELMDANGVSREEEAWLFSTVMDGAPIAAPDDEGTIYYPDKKQQDKYPAVHLLPTESFHDYQKTLTELLLDVKSASEGYTIPVVVYGTSARESFNANWPAAKLGGGNRTTRVEVLKGKTSPVICSGHPYAFFAQVQTVVGAGEMKPEAWAVGVKTMINDLAVIRWQINMAKNPKEDPAAEWKRCCEHWENMAQRQTVYELVLHQGSLWYPNPKSLDFEFRLSRKDVEKRVSDFLEDELKAQTRKESSRNIPAGKKTGKK